MKGNRRWWWVGLLLAGGLIGCTVEAPRPTPITIVVAGGAEEATGTTGAATALSSPTPTASGAPIMELLAQDGEFALLLSAVNHTGLAGLLQQPGPYTFFAPTNVAFSELGVAASDIDPTELETLLRHHLVEGRLTTAELATLDEVTPLSQAPLALGQGLAVEYGAITRPDLGAANGVVHGIDVLLLPPEPGPERTVWGQLEADGRFSRFLEIMQTTRLVYQLRFATLDAVLAPTDEAFAALPEQVVELIAAEEGTLTVGRYHILSPYGWPEGADLTAADMVTRESLETLLNYSGFGCCADPIAVTTQDGQVLVDGVPIAEADMDARNGIIHVIETVMLPNTLAEHVNAP